MGAKTKPVLDDKSGNGEHHKLDITESFGTKEAFGKPPELKEVNGIILNTDIVHEGGILTAYVNIGIDAGNQSFGGIKFNHLDEMHDTDRLGNFISNILKTMGVPKLSNLNGCPLRVRHTKERIYEIGHFVKEDWMNIMDYINE